MKYMIASDIHGSAYFCRLLKEQFEKERAEKLILLGDLLYHGARNPLPREYSTTECARILNSMKQKILCVKGNCDSEVDALVLEFPIDAAFCILPWEDRTIVLAHGHNPPPCLAKGDVYLNGHFHVPAFEERENYIYVNCGSVSIPKDGSPHSCLVLDGRKLLWKDLETGGIFRRETLKK